MHQQVWNADGSKAYDTRYTAYDSVGNLLGYQVITAEGTSQETTDIYTDSVLRMEGYKQVGSQRVSWTTEPEYASAQNQFDVQGHLIGVTDPGQPTFERSFINDAAGQALYANQGGHVQRQLIVNGQVLGRYGQETVVPCPTSN